MLLVFPGVLGAIATAQTESASSAGNSTLDWMEVHDSHGINLSNYMLITDHGSMLHPWTAGMSMVLNLEFAGWLIIVVTGIWLIGYVLSFRWLDLFAAPLKGVGRALTDQLTVPIVLITAATIGAFCVAWFVLRGQLSKATLQIVTMLAVAVLGPVFLADPLSEALAPDGLLAQGRDLGLAVAAGLNGHSAPQPDSMLVTMQEDLAEGFGRRPLQVWNFGHVLDSSPACGAEWSNAIGSGSEDRVRDGLRSCGDAVAVATASNPGAGQIGAGLLLLLTGALLLAFAAVLAVRIVWSALDAIYYAIMAIFGFAAGGFVYGPTQTFLVRSVVHSFFSGVRMAVLVVFLGVYVLFFGDLFREARDDVIVILVIGSLVVVVAIQQLRRLADGLDHGNYWIANRFAYAIESGEGGRGQALGMGEYAVHGHLPRIVPTVQNVGSVIGFPPVQWLWNRLTQAAPNPPAPVGRPPVPRGGPGGGAPPAPPPPA
ncbi:hypothetical protein, partial [Nocardia sp. NPDC004722]